MSFRSPEGERVPTPSGRSTCQRRFLGLLQSHSDQEAISSLSEENQVNNRTVAAGERTHICAVVSTQLDGQSMGWKV